jgi:hypothetical protein
MDLLKLFPRKLAEETKELRVRPDTIPAAGEYPFHLKDEGIETCRG